MYKRQGYYSVLSRTIYDGLKLFADAGIDRTDLDACVSDAILAQSTDHGLAGDYIAESHVTLGVTEEGARTTVYAMALDMHFSFAGGAFTGVGGGHMPVAITFTKAEDGTYTLEAVSSTHLDVYKRQIIQYAGNGCYGYAGQLRHVFDSCHICAPYSLCNPLHFTANSWYNILSVL